MINDETNDSPFDEEEFDEDDQPSESEPVLSPHQEEDGYIRPSAAESEKIIRDIVSQNIHEGSEAKNLVIGIMGLCRALNTMASAALQASDKKNLCCEASGVIAVTSTCERMIRSLTGFQFVESYRFLGQGDSDDED